MNVTLAPDGSHRPIPPDWHAQEILVALVQAAGGELTFDAEHMLTTSTRGPGGEIRKVIYEPRPDGTVRLSLALPEAGSVGAPLLFEAASDPTTSTPSTGTATRDFVQALLRQRLADEEARRESIIELEKAGHRIIGGGQTSSGSSNVETWEITDWRTGDVLVGGTGGDEAYDAAAERLDPDDMWVHIDNVDTDLTAVEPVGIPASLADALQDWLGSTGTSDEDVAGFVGWSVEEVARHRAED